MPLPAAAALTARRSALSAARKKSLKKLKKKIGKKAKEAARKLENPGKKISWLEILFVTLFFALPNDLIDIINLTIIGKLVTVFIDVATGFLLFIWFWFRVQESPGKKFIKMAISLFLEIMPVLGLFPVWIALVLNVKLRIIEKVLGFIMRLLSFGKA